jgi:hypothetical protein
VLQGQGAHMLDRSHPDGGLLEFRIYLIADKKGCAFELTALAVRSPTVEGVLSQLGLSASGAGGGPEAKSTSPIHASPQNPHSFNAQRGSWLEGPLHLHHLME